VKSQPDYIDARLRLAEAFMHSGRREQSLAQYAEALKIDPRAADARFGYAATLAALGRLREAREAFSEAAKLHPDQPRFTEALARVQSTPSGR
jgi:tetratricopeptide (TPR) repeat protein